jgi:hypothetical protein
VARIPQGGEDPEGRGDLVPKYAVGSATDDQRDEHVAHCCKCNKPIHLARTPENKEHLALCLSCVKAVVPLERYEIIL